MRNLKEGAATDIKVLEHQPSGAIVKCEDTCKGPLTVINTILEHMTDASKKWGTQCLSSPTGMPEHKGQMYTICAMDSILIFSMGQV